MKKYKSDWSWKEDNPMDKKEFIKKLKLLKKKRRPKAKKNHKKDCFYDSREWLELRYKVLKKYSACCMCCGRSKKDHNVVIHIDHINPRSIYPHLELSFDNLQILCSDCNKGKSNKDSTDWRQKPKVDGWQ
jgi:5-methylcytosine-specific restriction endonuclease McrA